MEEFTTWLKVLQIDIPNRELIAEFATKEGYKKAIFKIFSDELTSQILERYRLGRELINARIAYGQIIQVLQYLPINEQQLSQNKNPIFHTAKQVRKARYVEQLVEANTLEDKISNCVDLLLLLHGRRE